MKDVNSDELIDKPVYSDRVHSGVIVRPKACLLFHYTLKSVYIFFTKRVHTLR